ncbi:MAG: Uma2 family endonuclease [Saprospiraceae bacterium]
MEATLSLPISMEERAQMDAGEIRIPASYEDFIAMLADCEFPIEYDKDEIIIMSIASDRHEQIVANIIFLLVGLLRGNDNFKRYGSNRHVFIEKLTKAYSPDASVAKGVPQPHTYALGKEAYTNPWLVVEVLSPSSVLRDMGDKLVAYKTIPSLQYILYISQDTPAVTLYSRIDEQRWQSTDFNASSPNIEMGAFTISVLDIYENLD